MFQIRAGLVSAAVSLFLQLFLLLSGTSVAIAKEYRLFEKGSDGAAHPVSDYNDIVRSLQSGDIVKFSDGRSFQLVQDLQEGRGAMSRIFLVQSPRKSVLRLPQQSNSLQLDMINRSIDGYKALHEAGIPLVSIQESKRGEYLLVDQIEPGFTPAEEFFRNSKRFDPKTRKRMIDRLVEFAKKTAYFKQIGDFGLSQIVYVPSSDDWVLLDWTAGHKAMDLSSKSSHCFEHAFDRLLTSLSGAERDLVLLVEKKIKNAIRVEREQILASSDLLARLKRIDQEVVHSPSINANMNKTGSAVFMDCFKGQMDHSIEF